PGGTERLLTHAEMELHRDVLAPAIVRLLTAQRNALKKQMEKSADMAFKLRDTYFDVANSLKAFEGHLAGLRDAAQLAKIKVRDDELIEKSGPEVKAAFETIAKAMAEIHEKYGEKRINVQKLMSELKEKAEGDLAEAKSTINKARFEVYGTSMYPDAT